MKILELRLSAFGPFTDLVLDLSAGDHGFHVIFGPNEAGKSSALRALHALLFGIPVQTGDGFVHPYQKLRIGALLRLSSGEQIDFSRRKAAKGSLLGPGDTRLDDRALDRFLGGVGPDQFQRFWGIDHESLVKGGREILEGGGDLGASLFAAGLGASHIGTLRRNLENEAQALFAPRASKPFVNAGIKHLRELQSAQRELTVSAEEWSRHDSAAHSAGEQIAKLMGRIEDLGRERSRLERLKRVLPLLAEREDVRRALADLGDVVLLAQDFSKRRQDTEGKLRTAQQHLERVSEELQAEEELVTRLGAAPPLVAEEDAVNDLHRSLGSQRKASSDRPRLVGQLEEQRALAKRVLGELRSDLDINSAVEVLTPFVSRRQRIQKLATEQERLDERLGSAKRRVNTARELAATLVHESPSLPPPRDVFILVAAIEDARRRGEAESEREKALRAFEQMRAQRDTAIAKLGLPASVIDALQELRVPTAAAISIFERKAQELDNAARTAKMEHQRLARTTRELDTKIGVLRTKKAVPTEADLAEARKRRDSAFILLRDQWETGADVGVAARELLGPGVLIDLYPGTVTAADEVADRLRNEADRVAELQQCLEKREDLLAELEEARLAAVSSDSAVTELDAAWRETWKALLASPPQICDARAWHDEFGRLLERSDGIAEALMQQQELDAWIETQKGCLGAVIKALEPTLRPVGGLATMLAVAERLWRQIETDEADRLAHVRKTEETERSIREAESTVRHAQEEIEVWKRKWGEATGGLVPAGVSSPEDAFAALDRVETFLRAHSAAAGYEERISGIDRDAESFRVDVRALAQRLGETALIDTGGEEAWVEGHRKRLTAELQEDARRRQAHERRDLLRDNLAVEKTAVGDARQELSALCEEARCANVGDLVGAEERSVALRASQTELARIEKEVLRGGDGASIAVLENEATSVDKDAIDVRLAQLGVELLEAEKDLAEARDTRASALAELRQLRGPSAASEKAEEIQATLARLRDDVVRYARARVASTLLARRIDDYRRKNQAPLLLRAGALFREMTLGRFGRLEADVEEGRPVLVGVRPAGTPVPSEGMSEGTRDQLFFALRLAAVEASCAAGEPMPFVVDDVLVQFDDDRSAATLRVLAEVASRTQVVLFTHHRQVKTCAEALGTAAGVIVHEL